VQWLTKPARGDPDTGYRYYAVEQLARARLVAWLRRLGMPLALIHEVCGMPAGPAAREIRAYRARVQAETAAHSERGHVQPSNQDTCTRGAGCRPSPTGAVRPGRRPVPPLWRR